MIYLRKFMTGWITFVILLSCLFLPVHGLEASDIPKDGKYYLVDFVSNKTEIGIYDTYVEANTAFQQQKDQYGNLGIMKDGVVYSCEYGLIYINSSDACDVNINYTEVQTGKSGYTNGCYGKDALYLQTASDGTRVEFELSGVLAYASFDDVEIVPYENVNVNHSIYKVSNGILIHYIKTNMTSNYYSSTISFGNAPDYLEEGKTYESYDGHYFYKEGDIQTLIQDVLNGKQTHAINKDHPYYDYYQFVSHRTLTSYTESELEKYLSSLGITAAMDCYRDFENDSVDDTLSRSQFFGTMPAFFEYQYRYGANALMMISLAANESAWGRSALSYTRNNLFGHSAYDSSVEQDASRYLSTTRSIYSHASYYISSAYCNPTWEHYRGGFFGNKASGMNVMYASDPYWGEKAARYYRMIDASLGGKDENAYTLGIRTLSLATTVYADSSLQQVMYTTTAGSDYAFVIIGETKNSYIVQAENNVRKAEYSQSYYDYEQNIGYIRKNEIHVLVEGKQNEKTMEYVTATFDADDGIFEDGSSRISYSIPKGSEPSCVAPSKEHAIFTGWDKETDPITKDTTYTAQYYEVDSIEVGSVPKREYTINEMIDLEDLYLNVYCPDGYYPENVESEVPITTSLISGFSMKETGKQVVTVSYAGCTTSFEITIVEENKEDVRRKELASKIQTLNDLYFTVEEMTDSQREEVLAMKDVLDNEGMPDLSFGNIRVWDTVLRKAYGNKILYKMNANDLDFGISGLAIRTPTYEALNQFLLFADCVNVSVKDTIEEVTKTQFEAVSKNYSWQCIQDVDVSVKFPSHDTRLAWNVVMSIAIPEEYTEGYTLRVLYKDENGDIEKREVKQTKGRIAWLADGDGEYEIIASQSSVVYDNADITEVLTHASSSFDYRILGWSLIGILVLLGVILVLVFKKRIAQKKMAKRKKNKR